MLQEETDQPSHSLMLTHGSFLSHNSSSCSIIPNKVATILSCLFPFVCLLGLTFNILVLWAMWPQVKDSLSIPSYVVSVLCAALLEAGILPFGVVYLLDILTLGPMSCSIVYIIPRISQRIGASFVVWIFGIRYVAVTHPLVYHKLSSGWVCRWTSISLWLIITAIAMLELPVSSSEVNICFPGFNTAPDMAIFDLTLSLLFGFLPLVLLVMFWLLISHSLNSSPTIPASQCKRISILLFLVVFGFGVFFGPITVLRVHQNILILLGQSPCKVTKDFILSNQLIFAFHSVCVILAPLFYFFTSRKIKERIVGLVRKVCSHT